jgi:hydrogenase nickel incorporation protein HypA/HybF
MHEVSLVRSLLEQVARLAAEHGGGAVEEIRVEVGPLSGVEPLLLRSAFDRLAPASAAPAARLRIDEVELTCRCRECSRSTVLEDFRFRCVECGSGSVEVTGGDAFRLLDFTLRTGETDIALPGSQETARG